MKQLNSLLWKEWRESRIYLLIGLGIFLFLPFIGETEAVFHTTRKFEIDASTWVVMFGGVLAVFVAVGATCRDLTGRLEDFWRSRPISVTRWMLVKYAVGLAIVIASCAIPLAVELCFNRDKSPAELLVWYPFLWTAFYSIGYSAGCVIRRTSHAATLALAGLLLVYLVPLIVPPLEWLSATALVNDYSGIGGWPDLFQHHQLYFALGMSTVAIACLLISVLTIQRDWHIEAGQKMMYGLISTSLLLVFASAAFQLGTNLPILQQIDLPADEHVLNLQFDGSHGKVVSWQGDLRKMNWESGGESLHLRQFGVNPGGITVGNPVQMTYAQWNNLGRDGRGITPPTKLSENVACRLDYVYADPNPVDVPPIEVSLDIFDARDGTPLTTLRLPKEVNGNATTYVWANRLYVVGQRLLIINIDQPLHPKVMSDEPFALDYRGYYPYPNGPTDIWKMRIIPWPGLPTAERLKLSGYGSFDGDIFIERFGGLQAYQLTGFTDKVATFEFKCKYVPSLLKKTFSSEGGNGLVLMNHLLYRDGWQGGVFNSAISVFDVDAKGIMPMVGHFAAPGAQYVHPLADGRAVVAGGNKIWLVGPPPKTRR